MSLDPLNTNPAWTADGQNQWTADGFYGWTADGYQPTLLIAAVTALAAVGVNVGLITYAYDPFVPVGYVITGLKDVAKLRVGDGFTPQGDGGDPGEGFKQPGGGVAQKAGGFTAVTEEVTVQGDVLGDDVAVFVLDVDDAVADGSARFRIRAVVACVQVARGFDGFCGGSGGYVNEAIVRHVFGEQDSVSLHGFLLVWVFFDYALPKDRAEERDGHREGNGQHGSPATAGRLARAAR